MSTPIQTQSQNAVEPSKSKTRKWLEWRTSVVLILAIIAVPIRIATRSPAKPSLDSAKSLSVAVTRVIRADLSREEVFDAEFRPFEEIEVFSKVSGFIEKITVDVGDRVKTGQLLATLEIPELKDDLERALAVQNRSEEEIKKAEADHEEAHVAYNRLAAVDKAQPRLVAQQDLDAALAKDRASEATLGVAKQQAQVAKAEAKKLQTMFAYSRITAPFDGVITRRFTDPGALIQAGGSSSSPLVRLSQNERLRLVFPVSVSFVALIKTGDSVDVRIQSLARNFQGIIARFTRKIETSTRTMEVEVDVDNPDMVLIPGMYASVSLKLEHREGALVVPIEAVSGQKNPTVFLIDKESKIEERPITLGLETPEKLEVLSGLEENDLIMVSGRAQFRPGEKVQPKILEAKNLE